MKGLMICKQKKILFSEWIVFVTYQKLWSYLIIIMQIVCGRSPGPKKLGKIYQGYQELLLIRSLTLRPLILLLTYFLEKLC